MGIQTKGVACCDSVLQGEAMRGNTNLILELIAAVDKVCVPGTPRDNQRAISLQKRTERRNTISLANLKDAVIVVAAAAAAARGCSHQARQCSHQPRCPFLSVFVFGVQGKVGFWLLWCFSLLLFWPFFFFVVFPFSAARPINRTVSL